MALIEAVTAILQEVAAVEMMPRFGFLESSDITGKPTDADPDDIVTVVDHAVETALAPRLCALVPGSRAVGEESAFAAPHLLDALSSPDPVWLIDPLDGTKNFSQGDDGFGVMVALVERGVTSAGWILLPARRELLTAGRQSGAYFNGERIRTAPAPADTPRGTVYTRFMPPALAGRVNRLTGGKYEQRSIPGSAAVEYAALVLGTKEFCVYYRLLPWDHAAGALILGEAGGIVAHLDGTPYAPRSPDRVTVCAGDRSIGTQVRGWLSPIA
jgi:fructose-1,6-bisphosphatase/inositol monophosphatase family enzyme